MSSFKHKGWLLAGLALILLSNVWVLGSVAYNRSGEPDSVLLLSERELRPQRHWRREENSGVALSLQARQPSHSESKAPLGLAVMDELGFSLTFPDDAAAYTHPFMRQPSRYAIVVLELDGEAHKAQVRARQQELAKARQALSAAPGDKRRIDDLAYAEKVLLDERTRDSRLFVIDAGLDATLLRERYPDRARFALVPGRVHPWSNHQAKPPLFGGRAELLLKEIQLPYQWREDFRSDNPANCCWDHQYELEIAFGRRLQPWARAVPQLPKAVTKDDVSAAQR